MEMEFDHNQSNIDPLDSPMLESIATPATRCVARDRVITEPEDTERVGHTKSPIGLEL